MNNHENIKAEINKFDSKLRELAIREGIASFNMYRGLEHEDLNMIESAISRLWHDSSTVALAESETEDPMLKRVIELIRLGVLRNKVEGIEEIYLAKNDANQMVVDFTPSIDDRKISRTDLGELMRWEPDPVKRRKASDAFRPLEEKLHEKVLDLINRRNEASQKLGFESYPHLAFKLNELDLNYVQSQLSELLTGSHDAFQKVLDEYRDRPEMSREGLFTSDLAYLHENYIPNLDRKYFPADTLIPGIQEGYASIGIDLSSLPIETVIQDIPAGGFCFTIDPGKDVRILANPRDGQSWYQVLFHEYGHAVQGSYVEGNGSYITRISDPGFFWEGIAVLFEKASLRTQFLSKYVKDDKATKSFQDGVRKRLIYRIRRIAMDALFEYSVYLEPAGYKELTCRRAEMIRKYLLVEPASPEPTWTHDIFHITHPCYIQNYVLAEMMAFHLLNAGTGDWTSDFSRRVIDELLIPAGTMKWSEKVFRFSGKGLDSEALIKEIFPQNSAFC